MESIRSLTSIGVTKVAELVIRAAQMGLIDLHARVALPPRIVAIQQEMAVEREKLAASIRTAERLRETAATTREELRALREQVVVAVEKLIESSHWHAS